jgi:NlpC/P60 family putative phage cell wall peptidase
MTEPEKIVVAARSWLGTPYRHQASLKHVGCDCLGLVRGVWRDVRGDEPEVPPSYSQDWAEAGGAENLADAAQRHLFKIETQKIEAGDVLLFRWKLHLPAKHAGIATSHDTMIHAQEGAAVSEIALSPWWLRHLAFVFRFNKET